jgi:hypothetical protein
VMQIVDGFSGGELQDTSQWYWMCHSCDWCKWADLLE